MGDEQTDDDVGEGGDPLLIAVAERIRGLRVAVGISQRDFATAAGMTAQFANRVETGTQNLSLRSLARIARALRTTMAAIVEDIPVDNVELVRRRWVRRDGKAQAEPKVPRPRGRPRKPPTT